MFEGAVYIAQGNLEEDEWLGEGEEVEEKEEEEGGEQEEEEVEAEEDQEMDTETRSQPRHSTFVGGVRVARSSARTRASLNWTRGASGR